MSNTKLPKFYNFKKTLLLLGVFFFTCLLNASIVIAGCDTVTVCDAPPGTCGSTATYNGVSGPIVINNGGWTSSNCYYSCTCTNGFEQTGCTNGANSDYDPYINCAGVPNCSCSDEPTCNNNGQYYLVCDQVSVSSCCSPGCSGPNCNGPAATATPAPTPVVLAPTAPPGGAGGGGGDGGGGGGGGGPVCGNGSCEGGESCSSCSADCGACPLSGPFCGDGSCTGFETCGSCSSDCGACPLVLGDIAWWQSLAGHAYAGVQSGTAMKSVIIESFCVTPSCLAQLITPDSTTQTYSEGIAITGGGNLNGFNQANTNNVISLGTSPTRYKETYSFFYRKTNLGANPVDDFAGSFTDAQKPTETKEAYFHSGDLTIQDQWDVTAGQSYVVFVDGNLTLSDPGNVGELIRVANGGFVAFIVSGNITIASNVGNDTLTNTTGNVEGVYLADGVLTVASKGAAAGGDERFVGEGTFVGWANVELDRDYSDGGARAAENNTKPTEQFVYRPDLVRNVPTIMKHPHSIWQETK